MRSSVLDTVARIVMLVLAGLVSLSIIGAIGAMSQGGGHSGFAFDTRPGAPPETNEAEAERQAAPETNLRRAGNPADADADVGAAIAAAARAEAESAKWLEVIAYVLFAIAGLAALLVLILWRTAAELRRAADALAGRAA